LAGPGGPARSSATEVSGDATGTDALRTGRGRQALPRVASIPGVSNTARKDLHELVDALPPGQEQAAQRYLEYLRDASDPFAHLDRTEPFAERAEEAGWAKAVESPRENPMPLMTLAEACRHLAGQPAGVRGPACRDLATSALDGLAAPSLTVFHPLECLPADASRCAELGRPAASGERVCLVALDEEEACPRSEA